MRGPPGFIVNRVNRPFTLEALAILEAGDASVEEIDEAMRADGYPMGPFELMDLVGIDISLAAARGVFAGSVAAGDPSAERFRPSPIQERLVADGRLGRKTDFGFLSVRRRPTDRAAAGFAPAADHHDRLDGDAIARRITLTIGNEAYRAAGDGVATPADIDLAMRLGANHPSGPFERVRSLGGPATVLAALREYVGVGPRFRPAPALRAAV